MQTRAMRQSERLILGELNPRYTSAYLAANAAVLPDVTPVPLIEAARDPRLVGRRVTFVRVGDLVLEMVLEEC